MWVFIGEPTKNLSTYTYIIYILFKFKEKNIIIQYTSWMYILISIKNEKFSVFMIPI